MVKHPGRILALAAVLALAPVLALAEPGGAPEPRKPVDLALFMGTWFEAFRTPNMAEAGCNGASQVWSMAGPDKVSIAQMCSHGAGAPPVRRMTTPARVLDAPTDAKFEASFFGGIIHKQYWVLDHADDYGWMIASTSDGRFVSVLTRKPMLPKAELDSLRAKVADLGLNPRLLVTVSDGD